MLESWIPRDTWEKRLDWCFVGSQLLSITVLRSPRCLATTLFKTWLECSTQLPSNKWFSMFPLSYLLMFVMFEWCSYQREQFAIFLCFSMNFTTFLICFYYKDCSWCLYSWPLTDRLVCSEDVERDQSTCRLGNRGWAMDKVLSDGNRLGEG